MAQCPFVTSFTTLMKGCQKECDQKCVIDNHEVEILQHPHGFCYPLSSQGLWPNPTTFCTPRNVGNYITPRGGGSHEIRIGGFGTPHFNPDGYRDLNWRDGNLTDRSHYSVFLHNDQGNPHASTYSMNNQFEGDLPLPS